LKEKARDKWKPEGERCPRWRKIRGSKVAKKFKKHTAAPEKFVLRGEVLRHCYHAERAEGGCRKNRELEKRIREVQV